jgi:hypothetical protein
MDVEITLYVEGALMDRQTHAPAPETLEDLHRLMNEIAPRHTELAAGRPWYTDFRFLEGEKATKTLRVTPAPSGDNFFVATVDPQAPAPARIQAPGFWMNEKSGVLQPVVKKFLRGKRLTDYEISVMRVYLRQWIFAEGWYPCPLLKELRQTVPLISTNTALHVWLEKALEIGIDPL